MATFSLEDTVKTFTYHQALVVYWFCKGLSNENIAARYGYEKSWVVWQMSFVYFKLGLDRKDASGRSLHWSERRKIIREKICPIIERLTNDDPDLLERFPLISPNVLEGSILDLRPEIPVPPSEHVVPLPEPLPEPPSLPPGDQIPPQEPPPDFYPPVLYNAWLAVLEDDAKETPPSAAPPPIIVGPQRRGIMWGRILTLGIAVLLACAVVGVGAYFFGRGTIGAATQTPAPFQLTSTSEPSATVQIAETQTALPGETLTPTFTLAPPATNTSLPTNTLSPIGLVIGQEISDPRVTLKLVDARFNEGYDRVGSRVAPISHVFEYTNHSGETLLVQFDKSHFVVEDNTGRTAECWFFRSPYVFEEWNLPLNDNSTEIITTRCGDGRVPQGVTSYTLTIHPFTSLPESTWVVEVPR
jgi:hypothetical protein